MSIKVKYQNMVRYIPYFVPYKHGEYGKSMLMEEVFLYIRHKYKLNSKVKVQITYEEEDGEDITIDTNVDLLTAFQYSLLHYGLNPLRLKVTKIMPKTRKVLGSFDYKGNYMDTMIRLSAKNENGIAMMNLENLREKIREIFNLDGSVGLSIIHTTKDGNVVSIADDTELKKVLSQRLSHPFFELFLA